MKGCGMEAENTLKDLQHGFGADLQRTARLEDEGWSHAHSPK
jgi:hypothetical protein